MNKDEGFTCQANPPWMSIFLGGVFFILLPLIWFFTLISNQQLETFLLPSLLVFSFVAFGGFVLFMNLKTPYRIIVRGSSFSLKSYLSFEKYSFSQLEKISYEDNDSNMIIKLFFFNQQSRKLLSYYSNFDKFYKKAKEINANIIIDKSFERIDFSQSLKQKKLRSVIFYGSCLGSFFLLAFVALVWRQQVMLVLAISPLVIMASAGIAYWLAKRYF